MKSPRHVSCPALLLLVAFPFLAPPSALAQGGGQVSALEKGHRAFRSKDYTAAANWFAKADQPYWLGRAQFAGKRYGAAEVSLKRAARANPRDANVALYLGRTQLKLDLPERAVRPLAHAAGLAPTSKACLYWYATALRRAKRPAEAAAPLGALAKLDPKATRPLLDLGETLLEAEQFAEAAQAFRALCERGPAKGSHWTLLGMAQFKAGAVPAAKKTLQQSLRLDSKAPLAHYWMGRTLFAQERPDLAARAFQASVKFDPARSQPRLWLARARVGAGDRAAAIAGLRSFAKGSDSGPLVAYFAELLLEAGKNDEAAVALRQAAKLAPCDGSLFRDLARAHLGLGQTKTALWALKQAVAADPRDLEAWRQLGGLHDQARRWTAARDAYRHLARGKRPRADDLALLGRAELKTGNAAGAAVVLGKAIAARRKGLEPDPALLGDLGVAQYGAGRFQEAAESLGQAQARLAQDTRLADYLGRSLHRLGKRDAATQAFQAAIRPPKGKPSTRPQPRRYLGLYALEAGELKPARRFAERALQLAPKDPGCLKLAGRVALADRRYVDALTHLRAALKRLPKDGEVALLAGQAALLAKRAQEARVHLEKALRAKADPGLTRLWLGKAYLAEGHPKKATGHLERATQLRPKDPDAWRSLAVAKDQAGQPEQAVPSLRTLIGLPTRTPSDRGLLVTALRKAGDAAGADDERAAWLAAVHPGLVQAKRPRRTRAHEARAAAKAARSSDLAGELYLLRAQLLDDIGEEKGARAALKKAEEATPWSYRVALAAGQRAEDRGAIDQALAHCQEAARRAPRRSGPAVAVARLRLSQGNVRGALEELHEAVRKHPKAPEPVLALVRLLTLREEVGRALDVITRSRAALDEGARRELRSSREFALLWGVARFRKLLGNPLPARPSNRVGAERLRTRTGQGAYSHGGELIE